MYSVNFAKLILEQIYGMGDIAIGYVNALHEPIKNIYDKFMDKRAEDWYRLAHNGQVCSLEKVLNDRFDSINKRITIIDGNTYERLFIYTTVEQQPRYLGKLFIHPANDYADTGVDFIVVAPKDIEQQTNIYEFKALVNLYKLADKRYKIIYE